MALMTFTTCLKSDPPFISDSVYNRVNGIRCLSYPYYNKCQKFFQTSEVLYKGWLEVARDWLGNKSQWPKAPVVPATLSLCDELEDIQHQNKDVLHVNGLIITAYEFNGYASYLMFCCIDKLVETFKANAPIFCIDDRIIGAVFGNSVGDKETIWHEELERRGIPIWIVQELRSHRDTFRDRHSPNDVLLAPSHVAEARKNPHDLPHQRLHLEIPLLHVQHPHPTPWHTMSPNQYIMGDDATLEGLFLKKVQTVTTGLFKYHMTRSHLDDLVNTLHESGSSPPAFLKPLNPPNPEVKLRIWDGFDEDEGEDGDDDYDMMSLVDNMLQQGVLEADDDFQACVDQENSRKAEQAKEEEEG
ncbi:hypothetical protein BS47DRAFT_1370089 [Hydnum rufescens UP504]|uniref:Uncharacterized protein n=1 Tax=Hydnum rufescens UP504 TaxID=1448309 RepID=A0A9P6DLN6_9AGAM|nr:hypothetical protein BS47DRAFT_1370089 [Hydnum rufescens UP504]